MRGREGTAFRSTGEHESTAYFFFHMGFLFLGATFFSMEDIRIVFRASGFLGFLRCVTATGGSGAAHFHNLAVVSTLSEMSSLHASAASGFRPHTKRRNYFVAFGLNICPRPLAGFLFSCRCTRHLRESMSIPAACLR